MTLARERPPTATEEIVARIWAAELNLRRIGLDDDFIDLGSHSLQGAAIVARLEETFAIPIPIRTLFEEPTIADLAAWIDRQRGQSDGPLAELVRLQRGSGARPLFAVPGGRGDAAQLFGLGRLGRELGEERPVYAFPGDPPSLAGVAPEEGVAAAARAMVAAMREVEPAGPYLLLGVCVGGVFAWEMACQLEAAGETVHLMLIDTRNPRLQLDEGDFRQAAAATRTPDERRAWRRERQAARRRRGEAPRTRRGAAAGASRVVISRAYDPRPFGGRVRLLVNEEWHRASPTLGWNGLLGDRLQVAVLPGRHGIDWDIPGVAAWLRRALGEAEAGDVLAREGREEAGPDQRPSSAAMSASMSASRLRATGSRSDHL